MNRLRWAGTLAVVALCIFPLPAQHGGRHASGGSGSGRSVNAPPLQGVVISIHGKLKELSKKQILLEADDKQILTIRRTAKTKFLSNGEEIKPGEISLESGVTIDVSEDNDLKLLANAVKLDPSEKKGGVLIQR
jgi:hypothetical protein